MQADSQAGGRQLEGRVCLITGAAHGIGRATTQLAVSEGAKVALFDLDGPTARQLATELRGQGHDALAVECDVSDESAVAGAIRMTVESLGAPTLVVNNAAFLDDQLPALETDSASWDRTFSVTLRGAFLVTKAALPFMIADGAGSIVSVSSIGARVVFESYAAYCSAKAGLSHFTRSVAVDYGKHGVRSNAVLPGAINTREIRRAAPTGEAMDDRLRALSANSVLGRVGEPEEVAELIVYLLGPRSSFITGAEIAIDGGWSLR